MKKSNFEEVSFFTYRYTYTHTHSSSIVPAILTSLTCHCNIVYTRGDRRRNRSQRRSPQPPSEQLSLRLVAAIVGATEVLSWVLSTGNLLIMHMIPRQREQIRAVAFGADRAWLNGHGPQLSATKMWLIKCFWAYEICTNFRGVYRTGGDEPECNCSR